MAVVNVPLTVVRDSEESFVIHFGTEAPRVNAYTLASTLVALANAAKAANASVNPGLEIEIVVEALGAGSPAFAVPRDRFPEAIQSIGADSRREEVKEIVEEADLQIIRAILERKRRRWEFAWRGIRISAPITDDGFNAHFLARKIPLHPGDGLKVQLKMRRYKDTLSGVVVNDPNGYEVLKVLKHVPGQSQAEITP